MTRDWFLQSKQGISLIILLALSAGLEWWICVSGVHAPALFTLCVGFVTVAIILRVHPFVNGRRIAPRLLLASSVILGLSLLAPWFEARAGHRVLVGDRSEYDSSYGVCARRTTSVPNSHGFIAVLRQVECTGAPIVPASRDYFVFVHSKGAPDDAATLILAYREWSDSTSWQLEPRLIWDNGTALRVEMGQPSFITAKRSSAFGISIHYLTGRGLGTYIPSDIRFPKQAGWQIL